MIDLLLLRKDFSTLSTAILKKDPSAPLHQIQDLDEQVRGLRTSVESIRKEKNELAAQGASGDVEAVRIRSKELSVKLKEVEQELNAKEGELKDLLLRLPNMPMPDVPEGNKEQNKVVMTQGAQPTFSFEPKNHIELNQKLGWFEFEATARMACSQFVTYRGDGLKLLYALTRLMLRNNVAHGYEPVLPPYLVNERALTNSSNLPKFRGDFYEMEQDKLALIPTAEVPLTNLYAGKTFQKEELPVRHAAWTSCFRREAGGYGAQERGLIRIHQFEKVELYTICRPDDSHTELDRMVKSASTLLDQLGLHYQISLLAAQDCSFASAKTFDIEVWLPGQKAYYEVSSASNCTDFQARRAGMKFREAEGDKPQFVHTLNASSLALPRLMVALIETYQQSDGSVALPEVLCEEMEALW